MVSSNLTVKSNNGKKTVDQNDLSVELAAMASYGGLRCSPMSEREMLMRRTGSTITSRKNRWLSLEEKRVLG